VHACTLHVGIQAVTTLDTLELSLLGDKLHQFLLLWFWPFASKKKTLFCLN